MARTAVALACELYVRGRADLRGNWDACVREAKVRRPVPTLDDAYVRERIIELGGAIETAYSPSATGGTPPPNPEVTKVIEALAGPDDPDEVKWSALWRMWVRIGQGVEAIDPQQRLVLKDLIDRHFGKAGTENTKGGALGVVVLPALGSGAGTTLCPRCQAALTSD